MRKLVFTLLLSIFWLVSLTQDLDYARTVIADLTKSDMFGRGYISAGDKKAAFYIENEFVKFGMLPYDSTKGKIGSQEGKTVRNFEQAFSMKVNTFPSEVRMSIDNLVLKPGIDFLVSPSCGAIEEMELQMVYLSKKNIKDENAFDEFLLGDFVAEIMVVDMTEFADMKDNEFLKRVLNNEMKADAIMILQTGNLSWGVSQTFDKFSTFIVKKEILPKKSQKVTIKVDTKYYKDYQTQNVIGRIKGKKYPDKYIVIGAHYDHLGMLGTATYFPGANDNASGVAMLLDLAKFYSDVFNQPDYSMIFVGFGAEEAGLLGSKYFVDHPPVALKNIRLMINLDMMSTGETGMMVVNATANKTDFNKLKSINDKKQYLFTLGSRGAAAISDHHFFAEAKVPALYFYLMGDDKKNYYYHGVGDVLDNLSLAGYPGAYKLITEFLSDLD